MRRPFSLGRGREKESTIYSERDGLGFGSMFFIHRAILELGTTSMEG